MITLTDEERRKFALYLMQEAETDKNLISQMEKIKSPAFIIDSYKNKMAAKLIVEKMLFNTETIIVGGR